MIVERYIAKSIVQTTALTTAVLMAIFTFILFTDELGKIGRGSYTAAVAAQYIVAIIPRLLYQVFPGAVLLGTLLGIGTLASNGELTAMRAAGMSLRKLAGSILKIGLVFVVFCFIIGEGIAPYTETYAETIRTLAMNEGKAFRSDRGLWVREGQSFIRIEQGAPGGQLGKVEIYEIGGSNGVKRITRAQAAFYKGNDEWELLDVNQIEIGGQKLAQTSQAQTEWQSLLSPELLNVVAINPETMSALAIYRYMSYLQQNNIDARRYETAFWLKAVTPFSVIVMVLLAIPFILGPLRTLAAGHRILIGTLVGIGFHILTQISSYVGLVYEWSPLVAGTAPTAIFLLLAIYLFSRVR